MNFATEIELIKVESYADQFGELKERETSSGIRLVETKSIGMKEFYEAHAHGLKPEIVFIMADYFDYDNEPFIMYNSRRYQVLRTYQKTGSNALEIVCQHLLNKGG